jgi:Amt family ammonium transporter
VQGLLISGETGLFIANIKGVAAVAIYTALITFVLLKIVNRITPIRINQAHEEQGLDVAAHGEISRFHDRSSH